MIFCVRDSIVTVELEEERKDKAGGREEQQQQQEGMQAHSSALQYKLCRNVQRSELEQCSRVADPNPHYLGKPDPGLHQNEKLDLDLHYSKNSRLKMEP
jgi:hypothetical protein